MAAELNIKDLKLVRLVAEHGAVTSAARHLHVSQPAASQRLAQLQQRLGDELFVRHDGIMRATAVGERLVDAALRIEQELAATWRDLDYLLHPGQSELRVATQCYTSYRWLPFLLRHLHQRFPDLITDVLPEATESPYRALAEDKIDVALVFNTQEGADVREHPLFRDEMFAVMHQQHPLARRKYLNPQDFEEETLVLYTGARHAILDQVLHPSGVSPRRLMQVRMTEAIIELVRGGSGIAVLSGWAFDDIDNKSGLVAVRIGRAGYIRQWFAVTSPVEMPEHLVCFIDSLKRLGGLIQQQHWRRQLEQADSLRDSAAM